jgi:hypothetical protein
MSWKHPFDVVAFESAVEELVDAAAAPPAFGSVFLRSGVSAGIGKS